MTQLNVPAEEWMFVCRPSDYQYPLMPQSRPTLNALLKGEKE